jgi:hypothetical protein
VTRAAKMVARAEISAGMLGIAFVRSLFR